MVAILTGKGQGHDETSGRIYRKRVLGGRFGVLEITCLQSIECSTNEKYQA
jgi:hypothetical protein